MPYRKPIRFALIAIAIVAVMLATTAGMVWHTHVHTSEANCVICHLSHQPITNALSFSPTLPNFAAVGAQPEPEEAPAAQSPLIARVPTRAPPAA